MFLENRYAAHRAKFLKFPQILCISAFRSHLQRGIARSYHSRMHFGWIGIFTAQEGWCPWTLFTLDHIAYIHNSHLVPVPQGKEVRRFLALERAWKPIFLLHDIGVQITPFFWRNWKKSLLKGENRRSEKRSRSPLVGDANYNLETTTRGTFWVNFVWNFVIFSQIIYHIVPSARELLPLGKWESVWHFQ